MERYVIEAYGVDVDAERAGLEWLVSKARELGTEAAIVVPGLDSIDSLERVLGRGIAAYAQKNRVVLVDGVAIRLFTPRTQPPRLQGPVLVMWANTAMVESAEALNPRAICATGWSEGGLDDWKRAWAPTNPRTGEPEAVADEAPAAVRGAVASLSGPFGNDVLHPLDKKRAINAFKALYMVGVPIDSVLVRSLAIRKGWQPNAANRLAEIAAKVSEGGTPRGGDRMTVTKAKRLVAGFESEE